MKQSNQLSRNLAAILLIVSFSMTASARESPTDPVRVGQVSLEEQPDGRPEPGRVKPEGNNHSPQIKIVSPQMGGSFKASGEIHIEVVANDPDGWTSQASFFANNRVIGKQALTFIRQADDGEDRHYSLIWADFPEGKYELNAAVQDNEGASTSSRPIKVEVIGDQDLPEITVFARDALATETTGSENTRPNTAAFRVRRTGATDEPLEVAYLVTGSAENGVDYEELGGSLVIEANQRWGTVVLNPIADDVEEGRETIILTLVPVDQSYATGRADAAKALITDNTPSRKASKILKDGSIHLRLPAVPGEGFLLEVSENLRDWKVVDAGVSEENALDIIENTQDKEEESISEYAKHRKKLRKIKNHFSLHP